LYLIRLSSMIKMNFTWIKCLAWHHDQHGFYLDQASSLAPCPFMVLLDRAPHSAPCPSWFYSTKRRAWHHVLSWFYSTERLAQHHAHHGFIRSSAELGTMSFHGFTRSSALLGTMPIMVLFDRAPRLAPCPSWFYSTERLAQHHAHHDFTQPSI